MATLSYDSNSLSIGHSQGQAEPSCVGQVEAGPAFGGAGREFTCAAPGRWILIPVVCLAPNKQNMQNVVVCLIEIGRFEG